MVPTHENRMTSAHYSRMGHQECDRIHIGTLEILERTGVDVHDEEARQILVAGGASAAGIRIRIPKHMVFVSPDFEGCVAAVEMCETVAGGPDAFRRYPFATCYINVTAGLVANEEALQKCIYLAEKGLPQLWIPLNAGGVNSPATTAGCMASMNAGILLGVVLSQLVREGAPIAVPGWNGGPYNLKTMVGNYVLADEQGVPTSMGKYYELPVFGLGGSTDAKLLDHQTGMECTISLMTALLHGANIVHDVGFMDSGLQGSLQLLVMANETIGFLRAATRGFVVDDETLALDAGFNTMQNQNDFRSFVPPLVQSITFPYETFDKIPCPVYGRTRTPTNTVLEARIASLEGGEACLTAGSGSQALFNG